MLFLTELNKLVIWSTNIGNTYLEPKSSEKVYIIAGPEFREKKGATLIINKVRYGIFSSDQQWHIKFSRSPIYGFLFLKGRARCMDKKI